MLSRRRLVRGGIGSALSVAMPRLGGPTALSAAVSQSAHATSVRQTSPSTFTLTTNRAPSDLDPHSAYDAGSGVALQGPFEGLLKPAPGAADSYEPVLAASWTASADQRTWTFRLRDGVTFHDGTPLNAEAVRASFARLLTLGLAPSTVLGRFIDDPAQITAPDARTVVFALDRPQPLFLAALASPFGTAVVNIAALRQHEVAGDWGHAWAQTQSEGLGTGPYRVVAFDAENGVEMERYDAYWRGWQRDQFDRIVIRIVVEPETRRALIEQGDADLATTLPLAVVSELDQNPDLVVDHRYSLTVRYLAMTVAGPLQRPAARQALCWAFPYDEVIAGVYEGYAKRAIGPVAELCRGFDASTFHYATDLGKARSLLQRANVPTGTALTLMLPTGNQETMATAELLQANLEAIGLSLTVQPVDFATYVGIFSGDLPAAERPNLLPSFWSPDYNDGWNHLWPQLSCEAWQAGNGGHYCNDQVETLLGEARDAADPGTYQTALSAIQQIVTRDDPAAIYFAQPQSLTVLRRSVAGFAPDPVAGDLVDFYALHRIGDGPVS